MMKSKKIRVLVVDDSAVVRQTLSQILESDAGIEVMATAADPFSAAEKIREEVPDVITLDVEMPRMDGITFLQKIMSQHPIPVVMCSSLTENGSMTALRALEFGAVEIIVKPKIGTKKFLEESRVLICDVVKAAALAHTRKVSPLRKVEPKLTADAVIAKSTSKAMVQTTEKEITRVHGQSAGAFERIGNEMKMLSESMKVTWSETSAEVLGNGGSSSDAFKRLIGALEQLKGLMVRADSLVDEIERSVLRSSEIGARFSQHMKTVEIIGFETHMKALNAIVRAAHLGKKGQTLEVLAQEMSRLSRETREFVASVVDNLGRMGNCAAELRRDKNTVLPDIDSRNRGEAAETLGRGIEVVAENKNRLMEQLGAAALRAETLREEISITVKGLSFLPSLADDMTGCLEDLEGSMEPLTPFAENAQGDPDLLSVAYTMQRERDIHEKLFVGDNNAGFETELFPAGNTADAIGNDRDPAAGSMELFGDLKEEKKEEGAKNFGDNVELF
jgi:CheY-like chemotaxis protein